VVQVRPVVGRGDLGVLEQLLVSLFDAGGQDFKADIIDRKIIRFLILAVLVGSAERINADFFQVERRAASRAVVVELVGRAVLIKDQLIIEICILLRFLGAAIRVLLVEVERWRLG
jgi:hypothetical protein